MLYKLEVSYKDAHKKEKAAIFFELRKVKENLQYVKSEDEKRTLTQHIKSLRKQLKRYELGNITYKLKRGKIVLENRVSTYLALHQQLKLTKKLIIEKIRIDRQVNKTMRFHNRDIRGIKRTFIGGNGIDPQKQAKLRGANTAGLGGVNNVPGTISKAYLQKKVMEIKNEKRPKSNENHIGVEIEFATVLSEQQIGRLFFEEGLTQYIQLMDEHTDGRDERNERGQEIAIVAPESEISQVIEKVCHVLNDKISANITYGCGLHIHIDCRNRDHKKVFNNFFNTQEILYSMVSYVRRTNRHVKMLPEKLLYPDHNGDREWFCRGCSNPETEDFVKDCECEPPREVRYFGINGWAYKHHKTIEVRIHSGTASANLINNWIKLLLNIADNAKIKKEINDIDTFFKTVTLTQDLKNYVSKRIETFKQRQ